MQHNALSSQLDAVYASCCVIDAANLLSIEQIVTTAGLKHTHATTLVTHWLLSQLLPEQLSVEQYLTVLHYHA